MTTRQILRKIIHKFYKDLGKIRGSNFTNIKLIKKFIEDFNSEEK